MFTTRYLDVDGLPVFCRTREGSGPTVLLLQGGMLDSSDLTWKPLLAGLPGPYRLVAPDLPGYGRSAKPDAAYTTGYFASFVAGLLDRLEVERAEAVFGSSMSAAAAVALALARPERVARLVLSGAYGFQERVLLHEVARRLVQWPHLDEAVRAALRLHPAVLRLGLRLALYDPDRISDALVADAYAGVRPRGALEAFRRWMADELRPGHVRTNFGPVAHRIGQPTLFIHGRHDWIASLPAVEAAAARMPHARLHVFEDCSHLVPRERPEAVIRLAADFLAAPLPANSPRAAL